MPRLYSPNAVGALGLLFTPAIGAYFSRQNWRALGNEEEARKQNHWFAVGILLLIGAVAGAIGNLATLEGIAQIGSLVQVVLWFFRAQRRQISYVKERFGGNFERRSLVLTALVASVVFGAALTWYTVRIVERADVLLNEMGIESPLNRIEP